tara:strand:- start:506 stop:1432 length:927 start_codon:yes stop_codon:yes gene_type:complete
MSNNYKGIVLAGGNGSRLYPLTNCISKQLMPVYDKPMIYYPISTLMLAGIKTILIIVSENNLIAFKELLGDGSKWGISIEFAIQKKPEGIAQAFIIAESFLNGCPASLILGDNLFHGSTLIEHMKRALKRSKGGTVFAYPVVEPERYGVVEFDKNGNAITIEEKPKDPKSRYAVTGLYFFDSTVVEKAKNIVPSKRGELEITSINKSYLEEKNLNVETMGRGMAWLDTGTHDSLHEAASFVRTIEQRQGLKLCCPEEIAWRSGWINNNQLIELAKPLLKSGYGQYLKKLIYETDIDHKILDKNVKNNI